MVLSDGMVHFLKIKTKIEQIYQNYLVALMWSRAECSFKFAGSHSSDGGQGTLSPLPSPLERT